MNVDFLRILKRLTVSLLLLCAQDLTAAVSALDSLGRHVSLAQPAERIIALAPHSVENVFSAGAGDKLVGVVAHSDYPLEAQRLPKVGDFRSWSMEAIVALEPDLVVLWGSGSGLQRVDSFESLDIPVFVSEPRRLQDIPKTIRSLATLAGTSVVGASAAKRFEEGIAELASRHATATRLGVFYQIWHQPLQTLNGSHLVSDVIALCGGRNVFADAAFLAPKVSLESVFAADPDVIVASGMGSARPEWLDDWRAYPKLNAVRNEALVSVNPDHMQRATARILLGAQDLCAKLSAVRR